MIDFLNILIPLLMMHIICEFYLQPKTWLEAKKEKGIRSSELYFNSLLHGLAILLPAWLLAFDLKTTAYLLAIVTTSHFIVDLWKVSTEKQGKFSHFVMQQTVYFLLLAMIAFYMAKGVTIEGVLKHNKLFDGLMVIFAYLLILKPT
ncbi:DUF3307 domain-containing protein [Psychromonas sp. KJ10-2]|uniref:DUF3307 domain-containing protein n=1 Tax=Psychromonas sp. KJ10-2 TaxID=3391822 RepID=UPI0039B5663E